MAILDDNNVIPDNFEDWMRWIERRLRNQERHRHALMSGDWTIQEAENGDLVATNRNGTTVVIASP